MIKVGSLVSAAAMVGLVAAAAVQAQTTCVGDCSGKDVVKVNDLVLGVNISLNTEPLALCPSFDCNHTGMVTVNCLIQGVNNSLDGCPGVATSTPTQTPVGGVATSTPTATPTTATVERVFNIDTSPLTSGSQQPYGICSGNPQNTKCQDTSDCPSGQTCPAHAITGVFSSGTGGGNAAALFTQGPLVLELGAPDAKGLSNLTLKQDTSVKATTIISTCVCLKFKAITSTGQMYCGSEMGGGPNYDTEVQQGPGSGTAWTIQTGHGTAASNPGDGYLVVDTLFEYIADAADCGTVDCSLDSVYTDQPNPLNQFAFTTMTATAVKMNSSPPDSTVAVPGQSFDCATFATPGIGRLASGAAANIVIPSADVFRIAEGTTP